jgi:hypothetical protein
MVAVMTGADLVSVVFVDADTRAEMGRTELPGTQLPDTFEQGTTVQLGEASWSIEGAEPPTAVQVHASGTLKLTLRRIDVVPARDILYSLPTICDILPSTDAHRGQHDRHEMHEDDWRQVEMVHADLADVIHTQLQAIHRIYDQHAHRGDDGRLVGFRAIHVRTQPTDPLPSALSRQRLLSLLPAGRITSGNVGFRGQPGTIPGSFTVDIGPILIYGLADGDTVTVLALHAKETPSSPDQPDLDAHLQHVMRTFNLALVDWCQAAMLGPKSISDYLSAIRQT